MKKIFKRIIKRIRKWNTYWAFIEKERMECMKKGGRASW